MRPVGDLHETSKSPSPLDRKCNDYVCTYAALDPLAATEWGIAGNEGELPDFSPTGLEAKSNLDRSMLDYIRDHGPWTGHDAITAAAMEDRLGLSLELDQSGENLRELNNLASPIQAIRDSFDLMPRDTADDWAHICDRSSKVRAALSGYRESLQVAAAQGMVASARQVLCGITQAKELAEMTPNSHFGALLQDAPANNRSLESALDDAASAYGELAQWLEDKLLPQAPQKDAVGRDRYELFSELFIGQRVDLDETYAWGLEELRRIDNEQKNIANRLYGDGTTISDAMRHLDNDPHYTIQGIGALREWMQSLADETVEQLSGTEFDIPAQLRHIECMVNRGNGGIYYTPPTADFSRPGKMWWSVPPNEEQFHTWQERTTVFHEGVPGHHLQLGQAVALSSQLNMWRSLAAWNSGHGEGWALYAEQLMAELGYQDDLGNYFGLLDAERLRAARVVVDIGVHLGLPRPDGNGTWDADAAWVFLKNNVAMADGFLRFELDRYLGWPGQAPSYKVGAKLWRELRTDYIAMLPSSTPVEQARRTFHSAALSLGSLPMSTLREALIP